jgi:hypothetical protein
MGAKMKRRQFLKLSTVAVTTPLSLVEYKSKARQLAEAMLDSFENGKYYNDRQHNIRVFIDPCVYRNGLDGLYCWSPDEEYMLSLTKGQISFLCNDAKDRSCSGSVCWAMVDRVPHLDVYNEFKILCDERGYGCFFDDPLLDKYEKLSQKHNSYPIGGVEYTKVH